MPRILPSQQAANPSIERTSLQASLAPGRRSCQTLGEHMETRIMYIECKPGDLVGLVQT